jgi:hypothetical protein
MKEELHTLCAQFKKVASARHPWEAQWQELRDLIHPDASDFNRQASRGSQNHEQIMEGTAPWACEQLAGGLHTFLTSPVQRWFGIGVDSYNLEQDPEGLLWAEQVADVMVKEFARPIAKFDPSIHENYQDLGSIGTTPLLQEYNSKDRALSFKAIPLSDIWIQENHNGDIDTVFRQVFWNTRQLKQQFSKENDILPPKVFAEKNEDKAWTVIHAVFPREDRNIFKQNKQNKKFASVWFCEEAEGIFRRDGFDTFPYHIARWKKKAGEIYGRSPGMTCLPDIRLINQMEKTQIKSAQKQVDPPLLVPSDGFMMPIRTSPGSLIFFENGIGDNNMLKPLETRGRYDIGEDKMNQKRDHIMRCFYADWIVRDKKKERQTALEIQDDRNEMLQLMAPILGRLQTEFLGPIIVRAFNLLRENGHLPPAPPSLQGRSLNIYYTSPAAKAQLSSKSMGLRRFMQDVAPILSLDPTAVDGVDIDVIVQELALHDEAPRRAIRSLEQIAAIRAGRAEQQQMQQAAEAAQPLAAAMKDVATAKEKGVNIGL